MKYGHLVCQYYLLRLAHQLLFLSSLQNRLLRFLYCPQDYQITQLLLEMNFVDCNLSHSSFYQLKLKKTNFSNCILQEVDFTEAQLPEANFSGANLSGALFENTDIEKL